MPVAKKKQRPILAINLYDITDGDRLPADVFNKLSLGSKLDLRRESAIRIGTERDGSRSAAVPFCCPDVEAATIVDVIRSHVSYPVRCYFRPIGWQRWQKVIGSMRMTRTVDGEVQLNELFRVDGPEPDLASMSVPDDEPLIL